MMDKQLLLKILGKKDFTDLGDEIFNLRSLTGDLRDKIILNEDVDCNYINNIKTSLNKILVVIQRINDSLESSNSVSGYINSRKYLSKFINSICLNIQNLLSVIDPPNIEKITYYNNVLIDLILSY